MRLIISVLACWAVANGLESYDIEKSLDDANNHIITQMFNVVEQANTGESVVMSAFSLLQPLALLSLAAEGQSHKQLLKAIGMPNDNITKLVFRTINNQLWSVKKAELKIASKMYVRSDIRLNDEYVAESNSIFGSGVRNIDFSNSQAAADEINQWVEFQTNNRIKNLVDPLSLNSDTVLLLANSIYFKGRWKILFETKSTYDRDFHISKSETVKVATMHREGTMKYAINSALDAQLLELPYKGGETSLLVILPNKVDGVADLLEKLRNPALLTQATYALWDTEVDLLLPKFKIETTTNLVPVFSAVGVTKIFNPNSANLTRLLAKGDNDDPKNKVYLTNAVQKAFIEVNEEGTEASAGNVIQVGILPAPILFPREPFHADHPFVFYIRLNGTALFSGVFAGP